MILMKKIFLPDDKRTNHKSKMYTNSAFFISPAFASNAERRSAP